jgi:hypothetical protein
MIKKAVQPQSAGMPNAYNRALHLLSQRKRRSVLANKRVQLESLPAKHLCVAMRTHFRLEIVGLPVVLLAILSMPVDQLASSSYRSFS